MTGSNIGWSWIGSSSRTSIWYQGRSRDTLVTKVKQTRHRNYCTLILSTEGVKNIQSFGHFSVVIGSFSPEDLQSNHTQLQVHMLFASRALLTSVYLQKKTKIKNMENLISHGTMIVLIEYHFQLSPKILLTNCAWSKIGGQKEEKKMRHH